MRCRSCRGVAHWRCRGHPPGQRFVEAEQRYRAVSLLEVGRQERSQRACVWCRAEMPGLVGYTDQDGVSDHIIAIPDTLELRVDYLTP
jgi:hypothetical protein